MIDRSEARKLTNDLFPEGAPTKGAPSISIKRHCRKLSEKQTDELVGAVADLIVAHVKKQGICAAPDGEPDDRSPDANATERN